MADQDMNEISNHNPWLFPEIIRSSSKRYGVEYKALGEFHMGAPFAGTITVRPLDLSFSRDDLFYRLFGGPPLWSEDERYLAIPEWERLYMRQRLCIVDLQERLQAVTRVEYAVVCLESFTAAKVAFIDSPRYKPRKVQLAISELSWQACTGYPDYVYADGRSLTLEKLAQHLAKKQQS